MLELPAWIRGVQGRGKLEENKDVMFCLEANKGKQTDPCGSVLL